jgi:hypothetical protein
MLDPLRPEREADLVWLFCGGNELLYRSIRAAID